jgi:hypothetical protein
VSTRNKTIADNILNELINIQWTSSFRKSVDLLGKKYLDKNDDVLTGVVAQFFAYLHKV